MAKIYKKDCFSNWSFKKLEKMTSYSLNLNQDKYDICWPIEMLYNKQSDPVGYLMKKAKGVPIAESILCGESQLNKTFPDWDRQDLVEVCLNISKAINEMHKNSIILGDINGSNILVDRYKKVTLLDIDSCQIDDFPCTVGHKEFTRKIHFGKKYNEYLRNFDDDHFALTVLMFKILFLGTSPFAYKGHAGNSDNQEKRRFVYGSKESDLIPDGNSEIWSNLPHRMKALFKDTFSGDSI